MRPSTVSGPAARLRAWGDRLPRPDRFTAPGHDVRVSSRLGLALGVAFGLCFLTGLASHLIQHPPGWFGWPTRPVGLYRVTQGVHVLSGLASVPLLLAKLWSVYPKLFARPAVRSLLHALERGALLALLGAAFFELATGLFNVAQAYPWPFFFPAAHHAVGYLLVGSLVVHIAAKLPEIRAGLSRPVGTRDPGDPGAALSRRGLLGTAGFAAAATVLATAGVTVPGLRRVSVLSWRGSAGPAGLPVNRTARAAGVLAAATDPAFRLAIVWPGGSTSLNLAQLRALPQSTVELPIACVEGWSQDARWTGVRLADLLAGVGAPVAASVHVSSLDPGLYGRSVLPPAHVRDRLTLLALGLNGAVLAPDHGYPCRIIAPSRPGVLQTKWVSTLEVRP